MERDEMIGAERIHGGGRREDNHAWALRQSRPLS
jgi:hypothetical protein